MSAKQFFIATRTKILSSIQQSFVAGLLVVVPVVLTTWLLVVLVGWIDAIIFVIPTKLGIHSWWVFHIPGMGILLVAVLIVGCGYFVRNFLGSFFVGLWNKLIHRIPVVGTIHGALSQLLKSLVGDPNERFGRVALIPYPREGLWTLVFVTNEETNRGFQTKIHESCANVFVPTTPNPTSGFFLIVPKKDMIDLDMKVDDAFRMIISGGILNNAELDHADLVPNARKRRPRAKKAKTQKKPS